MGKINSRQEFKFLVSRKELINIELLIKIVPKNYTLKERFKLIYGYKQFRAI